MNEIYIEFTHPKSFNPVSSFIRLLEGGKNYKNTPSHVVLRFLDQKHGVWWIYQAHGLSLQLVGSEQFFAHNVIIKSFRKLISDDAKHKLIVYVNRVSGKSYGFLNLLGLGIRRVLRIFGVKISNPFADGEKSEVCTEAIYTALRDNVPFYEALKTKKSDDVDLIELMEVLEDSCH